MRCIFFALVLSLALLSSAALAGLKEGVVAYHQKEWMKAIAHLRPQAEGGNDTAMTLLANMYSDGLGVIQNDAEAFSLYSRAAEKGNVEAMVAVGAMHASGRSVAQNMKRAAEWFERAASLGNQTGAFLYASALYRGNKGGKNDTRPDFYAAYKWFRIAEKRNGNPNIQIAAKAMADEISAKNLSAGDINKADIEVSALK